MSGVPTESLAPSDARQALRQIVAAYGPDIRGDTRRCGALLRDLCPTEKREINLLLLAQRERVPDDLLAAGGQPVAVLASRLAHRLADALGLTDEAARWAVAAWAMALGLADEVDLPAPAPAPPPYVPPPYIPPAPPPTRVPPPPPDWRRPPGVTLSPLTVRVIWGYIVFCLALVCGILVLSWVEKHPRPPDRDAAGLVPASRPPVAPPAGAPPAAKPAPPDPAGMPVRRWDAARPVSAIALSPDGRTVATGGFKRITLWDAATGKKQRDIALTPPPPPGVADYKTDSGDPEPGSVARLCFSPDGRHLAGTDWGVVTLWDARTGRKERAEAMPTTTDTNTTIGTDAQGHWSESETVRQAHTTSLHLLKFSPDGKTLAADSGGVALIGWDVRTGAGRILVHNTNASALAFSPDGHTLAGGGSDGIVHLWDAATERQRRAIRIPGRHTRYLKGVSTVAFSPDGRTLATSHKNDHNVRLWDARIGARGRVIPVGGDYAEEMTLRPDGTFVCLQQDDGLNLRDSLTGRVLHRFAYQSASSLGSAPGPRGFALSADGRTLAAGGSAIQTGDTGPKTVAIWNISK